MPLLYGRDIPNSRSSLRTCLQQYHLPPMPGRKDERTLERAVLLHVFDRAWPETAPGLQPLRTDGRALLQGLRDASDRPINQKRFYDALQCLEQRELLVWAGAKHDPHGRWVELGTEALFGIEAAVPPTSKASRQETENRPEVSACQAATAAPAPSCHGFELSPEALRHAFQRGLEAFMGALPLPGGALPPYPGALPGSAPPPEGERSPLSLLEEEGGEEDEEEDLNNSSSSSSFVFLRKTQGAQQSGGSAPGSAPPLTKEERRDRALQLGYLDETQLYAPPLRVADSHRAQVDQETRAKMPVTLRYLAGVITRSEALGHSLPAERQALLHTLLSFCDKDWHKQHRVQDVGSYVATIVSTGDWRKPKFRNPARATLAAKGLQWLAQQQEPTHVRQSRPEQAPAHTSGVAHAR
jgi:hypothetical protein